MADDIQLDASVDITLTINEQPISLEISPSDIQLIADSSNIELQIIDQPITLEALPEDVIILEVFQGIPGKDAEEGGISDLNDFTTDDLAQGATNKYYSDALVAAYIALVKGAVNGLVPLDSGQKIPTQYLPAIAITDTFVVASQAAMLALTAQVGDVAIRTDVHENYILQTSPATVLGNWQKLESKVLAAVASSGDYNDLINKPENSNLYSLYGM